MVLKEAPYEGPVLIKTDLNYQGIPEADNGGEIPLTVRAMRTVARHLPARWLRGDLIRGNYPIFDHKRNVPNWVWQDPRYVVEKFTPQREGDAFVVWQWMFLGDQSYVVKTYSEEPIVKASNTIRREKYFDTLPPDPLINLRSHLGFDYGKFDFVIVDGEAILLDANKTSAMVGRGAGEQMVFDCLAAGIDAFVEPQRRRDQLHVVASA